MTNLEGRVILRERAIVAASRCANRSRRDGRARRTPGYGRFFSDEPAEIFEELRRASAGGAADYSGITYARIYAEEDGVFWPCPGEAILVRPACSWTALRLPTAARASTRWSFKRPPRNRITSSRCTSRPAASWPNTSPATRPGASRP